MKRIGLLLGVFCLFLLLSCDKNEADSFGTTPPKKNVVDQVSKKQLQLSVQRLVSFGTRNTFSSLTSAGRGVGAARQWIRNRFASLSEKLDVSFHCFEKWRRNNCNVVAKLVGTESPNEVIVFSGHYDSRASIGTDGTADAPGANDDASGVAVIIELARLLSAQSFPRTVIFLATVAEEQGLVGATEYAKKLKSEKAKVIAMVTNDIVGSSQGYDGGRGQKFRTLQKAPNRIRVYCDWDGRYRTHSKKLAIHAKDKLFSVKLEEEITLDVRHYIDREGRGGDHIAFLKAGYPGIRFTEPFETLHHQHKDVQRRNGRQEGDLEEFIDYDYMVRVVRANLIGLYSLLQGEDL